MAQLTGNTITFDIATGSGSTQVPAQKLNVSAGGTLVSVFCNVASKSSGPLSVAGIFMFDSGLDIGYYLPGTNGVIRSDANYTGSDLIAWVGRAAITSTPGASPFVFCSARNDTGSTVTLMLSATWELP